MAPLWSIHPTCVRVDLIQDQRGTAIRQVKDTGPLGPPGVAMDPITVDILEQKAARNQGSGVGSPGKGLHNYGKHMENHQFI